MATFGFIVMVLFGLYLIIIGVIGAYASYSLSGCGSWVLWIPIIAGGGIIYMAFDFAPFHIMVIS